MRAVKRETTVAGKQGSVWAIELTTEEELAACRAGWSQGLVRVFRDHPRGRAWAWARAKPHQLEEFSRTRQIRDVTELEHFS